MGESDKRIEAREMVVPVDGCVPDPNMELDPIKREAVRKALAYMDLKPESQT